MDCYRPWFSGLWSAFHKIRNHSIQTKAALDVRNFFQVDRVALQCSLEVYIFVYRPSHDLLLIKIALLMPVYCEEPPQWIA